MGKFTSFLKRAGSATKRALTSDAAKKMYRMAGKTLQKVVESEVGSAAIDGVMQGTIQSIIQGENLGDSIKQAVILNVAGTLESAPDPLSPGEQLLYNKVSELERMEKEDRVVEVHNEKIADRYGKELLEIRRIMKGEAKAEQIEGNEIKYVEAALKGMLKIGKDQSERITKLYRALQTEEELRTNDEAKIINEYRDKFDALKQAIELEQQATHEEAIQEMLDLSAEVIETAAEEVPIFGAGAANVVATTRAVQGGLKLKEIIDKLTGIDLSHLKVVDIHPHVIEKAMIKDEISDSELAMAVKSKVEVVDELNAETEHIIETIMPLVRKEYEKHDDRYHVSIPTALKVHSEQTPKVHIYTTPWDSDKVFICRCIAPHHQQRSFMIGFDLEIEFVFYEDTSVESHILHGGAVSIDGRGFRQAYSEFMSTAWSMPSTPELHKRRLQRSQGSHPIYMGSMDYSISYEQLVSNAMRLVYDTELQMHCLRGPLKFQRRTLMNALLYGVKIA
ncbi:outer capsid protein [African horse sickness virus 8]|uniref:Outer capsid protein VP5 n=1 Tax=African horse sickness virus 8 TaxID=86062 RepID=A0A189RLR5_AHSV8|nr:outer capsid protein [African horse sickness virus 8]